MTSQVETIDLRPHHGVTRRPTTNAPVAVSLMPGDNTIIIEPTRGFGDIGANGGTQTRGSAGLTKRPHRRTEPMASTSGEHGGAVSVDVPQMFTFGGGNGSDGGAARPRPATSRPQTDSTPTAPTRAPRVMHLRRSRSDDRIDVLPHVDNGNATNVAQNHDFAMDPETAKLYAPVVASGAAPVDPNNVDALNQAGTIYLDHLGYYGCIVMICIVVLVTVVLFVTAFSMLALGHVFTGFNLLMLSLFCATILSAYFLVIWFGINVPREWNWGLYIVAVVLLMAAFVAALLACINFWTILIRCSISGNAHENRIAYTDGNLIPKRHGYAWIDAHGVVSAVPRCNHFSTGTLIFSAIISLISLVLSAVALGLHAWFGWVRGSQQTHSVRMRAEHGVGKSGISSSAAQVSLADTQDSRDIESRAILNGDAEDNDD